MTLTRFKTIRTPIMLAFLSTSLLGCSKNLDWDMRSVFNGFDTSNAAQTPVIRPEPDSRGIVSYPTYQVVLARKNDTPAIIAQRLGIDAAAFARANGISPNTVLRDGELLNIPSGTELNSAPKTELPSGGTPRRHEVRQGETAFSVARLYDVPVQTIAQLNNLDSEMRLRSGQTLLIPVLGAAIAPLQSSQPGTGSITPTPPSAAAPLPQSSPELIPPSNGGSSTVTPPQAAPDLSVSRGTEESASARMVMPLAGPIVREYSKGRNDGIDIGGTAGAAVKAADGGSVAAITENTSGAKVVVIRHSGGLLSVYVNLANMKVGQGDSVSRGQTIGELASGASSLHFEVRRGLDSVDPSDFLPR